MSETKRCFDCGLVKSLDNFPRDARRPDGRREVCGECRSAHRRAIKSADYDQILIDQDHKCGICKVHIDEYPRKFSVDHNHEDYSIRGLLCGNCNVAIGMFGEDIEFLKSAIGYLMHHKTTIILGETWTETES